jgi:hypothetical protein
MKNAVFWDIKTQFISHRKYINIPLQSTVGYCYVRFEVFAAVAMKNAVLWDITSRGFPENIFHYKSHTALHPRRLHSLTK